MAADLKPFGVLAAALDIEEDTNFDRHRGLGGQDPNVAVVHVTAADDGPPRSQPAASPPGVNGFAV